MDRSRVLSPTGSARSQVSQSRPARKRRIDSRESRGCGVQQRELPRPASAREWRQELRGMRKPVSQVNPPQSKAPHQNKVTLGIRDRNPVQPRQTPLRMRKIPAHQGLLTPPPKRAKNGKSTNKKSLFINNDILMNIYNLLIKK
jgi:hypothetical protein